jgi:hypothetical protein
VDALSAPKPRNEPPEASGISPVRVGDRRVGGEVSVALGQRDGQARVVVNVAHLGGMSVDVSLEDAVVLRDGLIAILGQAGYE